MKHLKIEFDWSVRNRREDLALPLHLNSRIIFIKKPQKQNSIRAKRGWILLVLLKKWMDGLINGRSKPMVLIIFLLSFYILY